MREAHRKNGWEFDLQAFYSGGDPPCAGLHYDEGQAELRRDRRRFWLVSLAVIVAVIGLVALIVHATS